MIQCIRHMAVAVVTEDIVHALGVDCVGLCDTFIPTQEFAKCRVQGDITGGCPESHVAATDGVGTCEVPDDSITVADACVADKG